MLDCNFLKVLTEGSFIVREYTCCTHETNSFTRLIFSVSLRWLFCIFDHYYNGGTVAKEWWRYMVKGTLTVSRTLHVSSVILQMAKWTACELHLLFCIYHLLKICNSCTDNRCHTSSMGPDSTVSSSILFITGAEWIKSVAFEAMKLTNREVRSPAGL